MGNPIMRANNIRRQMLSEKNALYQQRRILFMSIEGTALNPVRLVAAALIGLVILLVLIIKFKIQAMVAILIGENSSKLAAVARAFRMVCRSFSLFVSNLVCRGVIPPAIMGAFCLSSAACPFFCAQYSRSVTRFLLPFKRAI